MAEKLVVDKNVLGRYERDKMTPSIEVSKKIADAFGVSLDYLVGEDLNASFDKKQ